MRARNRPPLRRARASEATVTDRTDYGYDIDIYDDPVFELKYAIRKQEEGARELRAHILQVVESGEPQARLARKLGISTSTLHVWVTRARAERAGSQSSGTADLN
jgi:DNA-directed RNA polymerase specialized sigma24 family protein